MKTPYHIFRVLISFSAVFLFYGQVSAQQSYSVTGAKRPKHYFNTVIILDGYRKPSKTLKDTTDFISKRLQTYAVKLVDLSFYTPLFTFEDRSDTMVYKNTHILLTGTYQALQSVFTGISKHQLVKIGIGIRYIFNSGKKGVWFVDAAPFITKDVTYQSKAYFRLASTIVYSYNVSYSFGCRLGVTKSFQWGNRLYLPFIGLRFGRLDRVNLSVQIPRSISLNIPMGSNVIFSFYSKPQGGLYNFSNHDSLYYRKQTATFNFTRYELNTGFRVDVRCGRNFNFYVATGISSRNTITFYSEKANNDRPRLPYRIYFYNEHIAPTLFFNAGLVLKFGKTRSYFNNRNLYDAMDLNNVMDGNGNTQIPLPTKKQKSNANLNSIQDLIDYNDF